jgi:Putative lumazine-binding
LFSKSVKGTNKLMTRIEKINQTITDFVRGGDERDTELLDKVLHSDFRVTNNGFMGTPGVTIIDKQKYLSNIKEGIFGGLPRKMTIENIDDSEIIAMVKLRLESSENYFVSFNSLVLDIDNNWKLINNLAVVEKKK